jgi:hypothetical protein
MNIETVKELELNYLVNDTISVPKDSSNRDCRKVEAWITGGGIVEQEDFLQIAKETKTRELKAQRDENLKKPTPQTITYGGNLANRSFNVNPKEHLPLFSTIISVLQNKIDNGSSNPTRTWSDASGEVLELTISDFSNLVNHLDYRDAIEYAFCTKRVKEVEGFSTIEEVEAFDITKIYE